MEINWKQEISDECTRIEAMLLRKNEAYGNAAFKPLRIFSKADALEQLRVRIDDKLSRLLRGSAAGEDTVLDLIGYLVLFRIMAKKTKEPKKVHEGPRPDWAKRMSEDISGAY